MTLKKRDDFRLRAVYLLGLIARFDGGGINGGGDDDSVPFFLDILSPYYDRVRCKDNEHDTRKNTISSLILIITGTIFDVRTVNDTARRVGAGLPFNVANIQNSSCRGTSWRSRF